MMGVFGGYVLATRALSSHYRALYKQRVLPQIAALFGKLDYRTVVGARPDLPSQRGHRRGL